MATEFKSPQQIDHCLSYIDRRLEKTSSQTLQIAEMMIEDIKTLTISYPMALKQNNLRQHMENVRVAQMKWVNQLHEIILDQSDHELSSQMIQSIQTFMDTLNQNQLKHLDVPVVNQSTSTTLESTETTTSHHYHQKQQKPEHHYQALLAAEVRAKGAHTTHH